MSRLITFLFLLLFLSIHGQDETLLHPGRVVFYNVENLFDTIKDPETKDAEYLPKSAIQWNTQKYQAKIENISKAIAAMFDSIQPIAIGLAEVENEKVIEDLIEQPALKKFNLGIVHHDSPDPHGLDVAFVYNKDVLEDVFDAFLRIDYTFDPDDKTRDIVYFKGFMTEEFPVYFFINHWPSNQEDPVNGEKKRITAAMALKAKIEDIYKGEPAARIIIMGDFNENPDARALQYLCSGKNKYPMQQDLIPLMRLIQNKGEFSYKNGTKPEVYDQFIVSKNLMTSDNPYYLCNSSAHIFKPAWLLYKHPQYGLIPKRTFMNGKWENGYSDHLPVYIDLCFH